MRVEKRRGLYLTAAWIGFFGGVIAAAVSAWVAVRQSRMAEQLARLTRQLDREERAEEVLTRYREPLAAAAFDLESRLYTILRLDFFEKWGATSSATRHSEPRSSASRSTSAGRRSCGATSSS